MGLAFASATLDARRTVHATFGVQGFYSDDSISDIEVRARWHDKTNRPIGDLENGGYAQIVEGIDRIVFLRETTMKQQLCVTWTATASRCNVAAG